MNYKLLLFLVLNSLFLGSQTATYNTTNEKGQKDGLWRVYLDLNFDPTDSSDSYFYSYSFYDDGKVLYGFQKQKGRDKMKLFVLKDFDLPIKGAPQPLNGTYKFYWNLDSSLKSEMSFENGFPLTDKLYTKDYNPITWKSQDSTPHLSSMYDYTKQYCGINGTYYCEIYFPNSAPRKYWFRKGRRWKYYRIKD